MIQVQSGTFHSFDDVPIYYEIRGQGEPVIFVYGIACLINHWHYQLEYFSQNFQTVAFDIRGHHKSGIPENLENLTLDAIAKDIAPMMRELGLKKAHFVGHSFGAQVILKTFDLFPELFQSITFINGFSKNPIKGMFGLDIVEPLFYYAKTLHEKSPAALTEFWKILVDNPLSKFGLGIVGGFNLKHTQLKDIEIYTRGVAHLPMKILIPYFEDMMSYQGESAAKKIDVPTLIVSGDKDMVTPQTFQTELHQLIKGSELFVVPYGSHCTQLDFPDYINLLLEKFFLSHKINTGT